MKVDQFDFALPDSCIAQQPLEPRDAARLLRVSDRLQDCFIRDLPLLLREGDMLVVNDSKVIPARLFATKGEAEIELLLHRLLPSGDWEAFARPGRKLKPGDKISIAENFSAEVITKREDGMVELRFAEADFHEKLMRYGKPPLPPYIRRAALDSDVGRYQTIYARDEGSVAAPTAGLHFTQNLLEALKAKQIEMQRVTLHVGAGTFQPVKVEDTAEHKMHSEWAQLDEVTADALNKARGRGRRIVAVGTTALRTLESAADEQGRLHPLQGDTDIFITPGYKFRAVDALITNFHLPRSTLFMLVCAFAGIERMKAAYQHAIDSGYRFYSYGDACLLEKNDAGI